MTQPYVRKAVTPKPANRRMAAGERAAAATGLSAGTRWSRARPHTAWALLGLMAAGEVQCAAAPAASTICDGAAPWRQMGRATVQRRRFSARVLPPLSRLQRLLPAVGARPLPEPDGQERPSRRLGDVNRQERRHHGRRGRRLSRRGRLLRGLDVTVAFSGGSAERARSEAERLVAAGAAALVSFGLAGGLAPAARAGDLLLPESVRGAGRHGRSIRSGANGCTPDWLVAVLSPRLAPSWAASASLPPHPTSARCLRRSAPCCRYGKPAVATVAAEAKIPFLVLRAVADPADQVVPQVAREALRPDGRIRIRATSERTPPPTRRAVRAVSPRSAERAGTASLRRAVRLAGQRLGFTPFTE